ncbi:MAG: hypothetical protein MZV49_10965 [Rhodopseudomonas palustris]|nr:hypothetical protein [Rhodopseudomonas palustris]
MTEAFAKRSFSPPWRGSRPVEADDVDAVLHEIYATPREQAAVAYLHVPYCPEPLPVLRLLPKCLAAGGGGGPCR